MNESSISGSASSSIGLGNDAGESHAADEGESTGPVSAGIGRGSSSISTCINSWLDSQFNCTGLTGGCLVLEKNLLFFVTPIGKSISAATFGFRSDSRETPDPSCPTGVGRGFVFGAFDPGHQ